MPNPYVTGSYYNFENRLHFFCDSGNISGYQIEGNSYTGPEVKWHQINKWNQEFRKIIYELSGVGFTGNVIQNSGFN